MFNSKFKIASISSEVAPFSKTGGLGDVARSLPKALKRLGHDVIVVTPFYAKIIDVKKHKLKCIQKDVTIIIDNKHKVKVNFWQGYLMEDLPIYFIENEKFFSCKKELYGSTHEGARFLLFNLAALKLLTKIGFKADIVQCHDWQTGLIPYFLKHDFQNSETLKKAASIFTIHNLTFQFGSNWWDVAIKQRDGGRSALPNFDDTELEKINFAKRAIINADAINAVSEQYAKEIMRRSFGQDLHRILQNRKERVFGIVNGIDYNEYNPRNDPGLHRNFDYYSAHLKTRNKLFLQKKYGLPEDAKIPLVCMTSRIAEQKGFDLIKDISDIIFRFNLQMIIMGDGEEKRIKHLKKLQKENYKKLVYTKFDRKMETSLYAGSDFLLMPSRFEPCGINQMISMRYGAISIARHIGGLVDTVIDYNPEHKTGNGFIFKKYDSRSMAIAISQALELYKREEEFKQLVEKVMRQSYSWEYPARKYVELFKQAIKNMDTEKKEKKK